MAKIFVVQKIIIVLFFVATILQCRSDKNEVEIVDLISFSFVSAKRADVYSNTFQSIRVYFNVKNTSTDTLWLEGDSRASLNCRILLKVAAIDSTKDRTTDWNFDASCKLHKIPPKGSKILYIVVPIESTVMFDGLNVTFHNNMHYKNPRTKKDKETPESNEYLSRLEGQFTIANCENFEVRLINLLLMENEYPRNCFIL